MMALLFSSLLTRMVYSWHQLLGFTFLASLLSVSVRFQYIVHIVSFSDVDGKDGG